MKDNSRVCLMLKSGKYHNITPLANEGETSEQAARRMVGMINTAIKNGQAIWSLVNSSNEMTTLIRLEDVSLVYVGIADPEQDARDKEANLIRHELLKHQLNHYKEINSGDNWKRGGDY